MKPRRPFAVVIVALSSCIAGCGHYPAQISSRYDIVWTSSHEYMIIINDLSLKDWPSLRKFGGLQHLNVNHKVTDEHLRTLAGLNFPELRVLGLDDCHDVTDEGIRALTNLPSITTLGLSRTRITDDALRIVSAGMPRLKSLGVTSCKSLTLLGFLNLTNAPALAEINLSPDNLTQEQLERLIATLTQVTWWGIDDSTRKLSLDGLRRVQADRKLTIILQDGDTGRGIEDVINSGYRTGSEK